MVALNMVQKESGYRFCTDRLLLYPPVLPEGFIVQLHRKSFHFLVLVVGFATLVSVAAIGQSRAQTTKAASAREAQPAPLAQVNPSLLQSLRWRGIGPYRGGRTRAVAGVPSQPNVFYIGVCNGGVWKTNDYGRTWKPIFDDQPTGSIGAVAVAA